LKRAIEQALLVRGNRQFGSRQEYDGFLRKLIAARNRPRAGKLQEELACMHELPLKRLDDFRRERVLVTRFSTIRVAGNIYSVPSRLIGEHVDVRLYPERIEVSYAGEPMGVMERLRGKGSATIDYRHLIWSLVRKPGAFANYCYREELFPTTTFRRAYDSLLEATPTKADAQYLRLLHLAASTSEAEVELAIKLLLEGGRTPTFEAVRDLAGCNKPAPTPAIAKATIDLSDYDSLLAAGDQHG